MLLVGHGSRDAQANAEIEQLVALHRRALPGVPVELGYIELARPLLAEALERVAASARQVAVVPLFLFASGHVKNDIPLAVVEARRKFPRTDIRVAPCLGVHPALVSIAFDRASRHLPGGPSERARTAVVLVGRGSSDPDSNADFYKVSRLLGEGRGLLHVEPAFAGIARPSVEESLALVARLRPEAVVVVPYLLTAGRLLGKLRGQLSAFAATHPWIRAELSDHLGVDSRVVDLVRERTQDALGGRSLLPCDNCQYRTPLSGFAGNVGGLRALLYSVRHTFTHAQATPLEHAHRPIKKHVFVCGNADCVDRGSIGVLDTFRRCVQDAGRTREIRVTRTSCMGRCGEGPTVAVYPDGIWYRHVREGDAPEIYREHLLGDRLVGRLVSDILQ